MRLTEVLFITSQSENKILNVFLHDPETGRVLRETIDTFMFRTVLPHNDRLELRQISVADERFQEAIWYLCTIPCDNSRLFREYDIAFKEMFEVATGYYSPKNPVTFPCNERITHAAVIFPFVDTEGKIFKSVMQLGLRHPDCFSKQFVSDRHYFKDGVIQGFWTDKQRFIDRYEAKKLALANGQLTQDTEYAELYSEDLW